MLRRITTVMLMSLLACSLAQAIPPRPPGQTDDSWFVSIGLTAYLTDEFEVFPAVDLVASTPWWHRLRFSGSISVMEEIQGDFALGLVGDVFGSVKLTERVRVNVGALLSAEFVSADPFVSVFAAFPIKKRFFAGVLVAATPEADWNTFAIAVVRVNLKSWSGN